MRPPITEDEFHAAQKTHDDYWSQYDRTYGKPITKIKNLGITDAQYDVACKVMFRFKYVDQGNIRSHELARHLLQLPDCPVVGRGVGQGSNEGGDGDLKGVEHEGYGSEDCILLDFGCGPMTE